MTDRISWSHGTPATSYYLEADQYSQNAGANSSVVRCYFRAINNGNSSSNSGYYGYHNVYLNSGTAFAFWTATPFLPSGYGTGATRWAGGPYDITVVHDGDGNATAALRQIVHSDDGAIGDNDQSYNLALTRIPRVPGAPGTPSAASITPTTATVSWGAAVRGHADITAYYLEVSVSPAFGSFEFNASVGNVLSKALTGLANNATHYARVRAVNSDGTSTYSVVRSFATPSGIPGAPSSLSASSITPTTATIGWGAASSPDAAITGYYLQVSTDPGFGSFEVNGGVGLVLSYAASGLAKNASHYVRVAAISTYGTGPWQSGSFTTPLGVPGAPTSITCAYVSDSQVSAGWAHNSPADSFPTSSQVRKSVNGGAFSDLAPISVATSVAVPVAANQKVVVQVRETNSTGSSAWSASSGAAFTTPAAPTGVSAAKNPSADIVVSWTPNVAYTEHQHVVGHGTITGGVTTWDASSLGTAAGGTSTYTHAAPDPAKVHVYRVYAASTSAPTISGGWVQSNAVQLLAAPNKPTFPTIATYQDKAAAFVVPWIHNPVDSTAQTAYELEYSTNGGSSWTSTGKITSTTESKTFTASTFTADTSVMIRVRTYGQSATASPWSDSFTVTFKTRPVMTITSPATGGTYTQSALTVVLGFSQAESASFVSATIQLLQGATVLETLPSTTLASTLMGTRVTDGVSYSVKVTVTDSNGLTSDVVTSTFAVAYTLPVPAGVTATYLPDSGIVQLDLTIAAPGVGESAAVSVTILREIGGKTETVIENYPSEATLTILDMTPTINGTNIYTVITTSGDGAVASTIEPVSPDEGEWGFMSTGPGFSQIVKFAGNFALEANPTVDSVLVKAAGRKRAIALYGATGGLVVSGSCLIAAGFGSTADELEEFLSIPLQGCYRDPSGRRMFGRIIGSVARQNSMLGTFSYTVDETS